MDVDANDQWMDSDSIIRTVLTLSRLCNLKCVNHPIESQQMGWEMIFPNYGIRNASAQRQKLSVLADDTQLFMISTSFSNRKINL